MKLYGLYGKSGTGKSHTASEVMRRYNIEALIDDGLLIHEKKRAAGRTAKNETAVISATKRATFFSDSHRREVQAWLTEHQPGSLLILGTSRRMIRLIQERLGLPEDIEWLAIESFQTPKEIDKAKIQRARNLHVIPVFPDTAGGAFAGSWFRRLVIRLGVGRAEVLMVKPVYTAGDRITVSSSCVRDMIQILAVPHIRLDKMKLDYERVQLSVTTGAGVGIEELADWRQRVLGEIQEQLGLSYTIDLYWKSISREALPGAEEN
ncbi:hypothetical protein [Alkalicoccus urumqiensis]|uniref:Uncharacterized protein n=1 Tax=Alkalicoccus urumqiensis TaxID=1548213 RepID=A0A2P6MLR3_ALKUR|nr:hypothetical protein [Alkalicoccus urumqiensis]PRO67237.1 hypothetical protein C6I21_01360 [Alkalicoccus urumqiensis]